MKKIIFILSILFSVAANAQNDTKNKTVSQPPGSIFTYVEHMPKPPYNLNEYLSQNIVYPAKARKKNIEGKVMIKFVVDLDGSITDCTIIKSVDKLLDKEALRVVSRMPAWNPGFQNGKVVRVYFTLPINFKLQ